MLDPKKEPLPPPAADFKGFSKKVWMRSGLMTLYFFLTITAIYVLKPVQRSLFIAAYGAEKLSWAYMAEGPFLVVFTFFYLFFAKRVSRKVFYHGILIFFTAALGGFWILAKASAVYAAGAFYLWHAALSITLTTVFWTLANELFTTSEAKRCFGWILSGGSAGGIMGGLAVKLLMAHTRTEHLILVGAGLVALSLAIVHLVLRPEFSEPGPSYQNAEPLNNEEGSSQTSAIRHFFSSKYLLCLCAVVMCAKIAAAITDNQLSVTAAQTFTDKDQLTAFFGGFFAWLNGISFLMQSVLTGIMLRYVGVGASLLLLPVGLFIFGGVTAIAPSLAAAMSLRVFEGSTTVSVQKAVQEVLYLPIPNAIRRRVKPLIDMLGYRWAKSLGGLMIAVMLPLLHCPANQVSWLLCILAPFWVVMTWGMIRLHSREQFLMRSQAKSSLSELGQEKNQESGCVAENSFVK